MGEFLYSDTYLKDLAGAPPVPLHPRFHEMIEYMKRVAPAGAIPGRQHIDPLDFPKVLPLINLVDVERGEGQCRFRFRLVGTVQTDMAGRDITGLRVEDAVLPELASRILANMRRVVATTTPVYDRFPMPHPNREFIISERMYFPLARDGEVVDMLLILNGYS